MTVMPELAKNEGAPSYWRVVIVVMAIYTYAFVDRVILSLLVDPIKADLGASDVQMGMMLGLAFAAFYGVFGIPAGHFVDKVNRRRLIGIASVAWALMTIVCGMSETLTQLFVGRIGVGVAEAVVTPAAFSLIRDAVPSRSRGLAFSIFAMSPMIGGAASLIGGSALLKAIEAGALSGVPLLGALEPWQSTLVIVGACGLPFSLALLFISEPARQPQPDAQNTSMFGNLREAGAYIFGNARLYVPLLLYAGIAAAIPFSNGAWLPTAFARRWELLPQQVGPVLGLLMLSCGITGLMFSGMIMNRIVERGGDIRRFGALCAMLSAVGLAGAILAPTASLAFASVGFGTFFLGNSYSVGATSLADITPVALMGRVSAVYLLVQNLFGQALGPLTVALVASYFAGRNALPYGFALSMLLFTIATVTSALALGRAIRRNALS
jgi:MFS transporter, Spinster family, sphingosine-1-phosphate transporter